MMIHRSLAVILLACAPIITFAQGQILHGQLLLVDENGQATPAAAGVEITMAETGATDRTDAKGLFRIGLPKVLLPGSLITLDAAKPGWLIWQPEEGKGPVPQGLLTVKLLPKGSKRFWTDSHIQAFIESTAEKAKQQVQASSPGERPKPIDFAPLIRDWAEKYGFTPEEAKAQIDKWVADVETSQQDFYKLGLAAFADRNFGKASDLFAEAGQNSEKQLKAVEQQEGGLEAKRTVLLRETVRNYQKEGDAHYSGYAFSKAQAAYQKALTFVDRKSEPALWAQTQVEIGMASDELATRSEGPEIARNFAQAVAAYRAALEVRTREELPQDWAATQNNLGAALDDQGTRSAGEEGRQLLAQAVAAYRAALEVYTREQLPQDWAMTQNNLGNALSDQGTRTAGEEGRQLLAQAVAAYRAALNVRTREQLPQAWAATQNNLGAALWDQGTRSAGEEGRQLLAQAVAAYRAALEVYTREQLPQDWAMTQNNLGNALSDQGTRTAGEEGRQLLAQAVTAYRAALEVRTREQLPQDWATTMNNLGTALHAQGTRSAGEEGRQLLAQAVAAYHAALEVRTREQLPQDWATTQNNLAKAYAALAEWSEAAECYRNVLQIYPDYEEAYKAFADICHERLFDFATAVALHENWTKKHSGDWSAQSDLAEALFTVGKFFEAESQISSLNDNSTIPTPTRAALRALEIAALLAQKQTATASTRMREFREFIAAQPADFRITWTWEGTIHFVQTDERLAHERLWLESFFKALQAENRDAILASLSAIAENPSR